MPTSRHSYKEQFRETVLGFLWRQWSALGVAGQASQDDDRIIDPEALLLITCTLGRHDPRLFDEVLDWLWQEGGTINLLRLKNLHTAYLLGDSSVLTAVAATIGQRTSHLKWRTLARELSAPPRLQDGTTPNVSRTQAPLHSNFKKAEPLFHDVPIIGTPDEIFSRFGWLRDAVQLRKLSTAPDPHLPSNFLLKLRALVGLQARAEILACLLCSNATHPALIAEHTGYFPRTVQLALNEMMRSGHLFSTQQGREKHFQIWKEEWRFLVRPPVEQFPRWIVWGSLFALLEALDVKVSSPEFDTAPPAFQALELRGILDQWSPALMRCGLPVDLQLTANLKGKEFVDSLFEEVSTLLKG